MPELPEVQTIVNDLQAIAGDTITGFWTNFEKAIKSKDLKKNLVGQKISSIKRIGKNIVIELSNNKFLVLHLKMTGKLILIEHRAWNMEQSRTKNYKLRASHKHLHHVFKLKKNGFVEFHDIRKFATLEIISKERLEQMTREKGIDPLSKDFAFAKFKLLAEKYGSKSIKSFLMDQKIISGIGNIYASEIPFETKISPLRKLNSLKKDELKSLHKAITKILEKAVRLRGTSFSDYRDARNLRGSFQDHLKVYKKAGKSCAKCGTIIEKSVVEQRSTFHCPTCQI